MKFSVWLISAVAATLLPTGSAMAAACTAQDFAAAIDQSGASLRTFNKDAQPKLQDRMRRYSEVTKAETTAPEDIALDAIQDARLEALDAKSGELLLRIDSLGRVTEAASLDCAKLDEIKTLSRDLLTIMQEKSDYMLARLDAKISELGGAAVQPKEQAAKAPAAKELPAQELAAKGPAAPPAVAKPAPEKQAVERPPATKPESEAWTAASKANDAYVPPPSHTPVENGLQPPPIADAQSGDGYSIEEIRDATRGFFGTVSTNLAGVIEHAFKTTGRPSAYVLGTEGGGAFLAGLRFGQGTLYMRNLPGTRPVYWHGPSLGTDFGASGSRTMFLIYKMQQPDNLFRTFTGVDGSAYFVGGVGLTLLKGGDVIMAPIRTGLGFRLGANIGYLRFVEKPTWNPF